VGGPSTTKGTTFEGATLERKVIGDNAFPSGDINYQDSSGGKEKGRSRERGLMKRILQTEETKQLAAARALGLGEKKSVRNARRVTSLKTVKPGRGRKRGDVKNRPRKNLGNGKRRRSEKHTD